MNKWLSIGVTSGVLFSVAALSQALAVTPVIDASNLAQAVKQVSAWQKQYTQMTEQILHLKASYEKTKAELEALTGSRGLGAIMDNPRVRDVLPSDLVESYTVLSEFRADTLSAAAWSYKDRNEALDCTRMEDRLVSSCEVRQNLLYQDIAFQTQTLDRLRLRTQQIDDLKDEINQTQDPKAIYELQARLQVEQSHIANEKIILDTARALTTDSQALAQQKMRERTLARLSKDAPSAAATFVFNPNARARP
ncbi:type IV secretion system protein [Asticcacaulis excentricus]|uniref:Type IV secretion system family protein n=1 Tax=Asticcacaulis excentricus (strain ATCC 15261 / DSM 4724 / KCTC 12464 / NCIMB 9791 / VKM B-1370 / CB 48) TaxID=573065 RepID=E8RME5_ASTEC|nr:type IV secretion system protein [Asticcacaulis excentricus]ADU13896.1 type IV secretion system family protein [Asticcacaulis excentricus CB 48]